MNEAGLAVFWGIVTFSLLVVLHEGGHFLTARAFGVKVHEFMIGLPGPAIRVKGAQTAYGITAIPLGGYVRIAGMEPGPEDPLLGEALAVVTRDGTAGPTRVAAELDIDDDHARRLLFTLQDWYAIVPTDDEQRELYRSRFEPAEANDMSRLLDEARRNTYRGLSTGKRVVVLSAGVVVNLLTALLVFVIVLAGWGYYQQTLTLERVLPDEAAYAAGLRAGDTVRSLDGEPVDDWQSFLMALAVYEPSEELEVGYERDGDQMTSVVTLGTNPDTGGPYLGIEVGAEFVRPSVFEALKQSIGLVGAVFAAIAGFFNPDTFEQSVQGAAGVVGVSYIAAEAARRSALDYAWVVAFLSLSLGVMNLLPLPPLDGGKVMMELIEKGIGHPVSRRLSLGLSAAGALLLFALVGYLMYSDVVRYVVNS